jgi:cytochrome c oxidase subunit 5a
MLHLTVYVALNVTRRFASDAHKEESYEEYTQRYVNFFNKEADDLFELSRGLNNAFCTDIVPAPQVIVAALNAARKLNSFAVAARTIEALRDKINDEKIYAEYIKVYFILLISIGTEA